MVSNLFLDSFIRIIIQKETYKYHNFKAILYYFSLMYFCESFHRQQYLVIHRQNIVDIYAPEVEMADVALEKLKFRGDKIKSNLKRRTRNPEGIDLKLFRFVLMYFVVLFSL